MMGFTWKENGMQRNNIVHVVNTGTERIMPKDAMDGVKRFEVDGVVLEGDELEYVKEYFTSPPTCNRRVIIYTGDMARFIAINLP